LLFFLFFYFFVSLSLCSFLASGSFLPFDQFGGVFKQKLKLMPPPLSLHKQLLTLMNAQKVEQYYIIVIFTKLLFACVCARESKRERAFK